MNSYGFKHKVKWPKRLVALTIVAVILGVGIVFTALTTPDLEPTLAQVKPEIAEPVSPLPWPGYGQAAVGAVGYGVLATNGEQNPVPMASLGKVMAAYAILDKYPLQPGEQGQSIPISYTDVERFNEYQVQNGTVARVVDGQQMTQYQALEAMLIASANNVADTTVIWAFGSMENYLDYANNLAVELGLEDSHFADASGWSPATVGTAADLVKLGDKAMQNPIFAEIVAKWSVTQPEAGELFNTNVFLDYEGNHVVGIKTGYTEQAGGTYLTAAKYQLSDDQEVTVVAAVLGAPSHFQGQQDAMPLLQAARDNFHVKPVLTKGQSLGEYDVPWGDTVTATVTEDVVAPVWGDKVLLPEFTLDSVKAPLGSSAQVGVVKAESASSSLSIPINLSQAINPPPLGWRLFYGVRNLFGS